MDGDNPTTEEHVGEGATTLDYLKVRYEWLGVAIDEYERRTELEEENQKARERIAELEADNERLIKTWVPMPGEMSGWDDEYADDEVLLEIGEACWLHNVEMPPHVAAAWERMEAGDA